MDGRRAGRLIALTACLASGCTLAPRKFRDANDPAPLVRARALSLGDRLPDRMVIPTLLDRLDDPDPVVRMTAHEELRRRTGRDYGFRPWDDPAQRQQAAALWRAWWEGKLPAGTLPTPQGP
jgi:hypothetical protein